MGGVTIETLDFGKVTEVRPRERTTSKKEVFKVKCPGGSKEAEDQ